MAKLAYVPDAMVKTVKYFGEIWDQFINNFLRKIAPCFWFSDFVWNSSPKIILEKYFAIVFSWLIITCYGCRVCYLSKLYLSYNFQLIFQKFIFFYSSPVHLPTQEELDYGYMSCSSSLTNWLQFWIFIRKFT